MLHTLSAWHARKQSNLRATATGASSGRRLDHRAAGATRWTGATGTTRRRLSIRGN